MAAQIYVTPDFALLDDRLVIRITGLRGKEQITVHATKTESRLNYSSYGYYSANADGVVDLSRDRCISGTYSGIDSMGLFWSMQPEPGQTNKIMYLKQDVEKPDITNVSVYREHVTETELLTKKQVPVVTKVINRWYKRHDVKREIIRVGAIRGVLFTPPGDGPYPGVVELFGSFGNLVEHRASLLASRGFIVFALAYFAFDDLPRDARTVSLDYLKEGIEWFTSLESIAAGGIGLLGLSKGAELATILAILYPQVKALITVNRPPFITSYPLKSKEGNLPNCRQTSIIDHSKEDDIWKIRYFDDEANKIQVWKSKAQMLDIIGEDDELITPSYQKNYQKLFPRDFWNRYKAVYYPGAGHIIQPPYTILYQMYYERSIRAYILCGGHPKEYNTAQEDIWQRTLEFFRKHLKSADKNNESQSSSKL